MLSPFSASKTGKGFGSPVKNPIFNGANDYANSVFDNMPLKRPNYTVSVPNKGGTTSTGGSSGSGSTGYGYGSGYGSGGSSGGVSAPVSNPYADWYAQQQALLAAAEEAKRKAAQEAYDRGMGALNGAYNSARDMLQKNYDSSVGVMTDSYNNGVAGVNRQADKTQNQAYINYMLSKRDLPKMMAAQGLTGGAAESTMAGLQNNYGNSRNEIDVGRNESLTGILQEFNANKASALQALNSSLVQLENQKLAYQMQLEQALQQGITGAIDSRYDALADIGTAYLSNTADWNAKVQEAALKAAAKTYSANNGLASLSTQQGAAASGGTNYSAVERMLNGGYSQEEMITELSAMGYTASDIQKMLNNYAA